MTTYSAAESVLAGGGAMGELMRELDWAGTPLGPVESWPQSLRTALGILLNSGYPMLIVWGRDFVQLYNDAYRPVLGATKHPAALGQSSRDCWPEIWDYLHESFTRVLNGEEIGARDQLFVLDRNGYIEETYFDFSYSPIRDETGGVGGVFVTCMETTERVLGERRLRTLRELAARTAEPETAERACAVSLEVLGENAADIPFALVYLSEGDTQTLRLAGNVGVESAGRASPERVGRGEPCPWPLFTALDSGKTLIVDDVLDRVGELTGSPWPEPPHSACVLPISGPARGAAVAGVLVAGISARRALDDDYQGFLDLVTGHVATAVASARAFQETQQRVEALAELDRAKTAFFSNVSHEFRTPLTLLLAPIEEALADDSLPATQRERLELVHRNALRLLKLVNTLLDFSRIEAARTEATFAPTDLAGLTCDLASVFRAAVEKAGLRLVVDCPPLPEEVHVDREMWEKIVLNLVANAFKFTLEGQITVSLRAEGRNAVLRVRDTGRGIPAEELPRVFERFHRVRDAGSRSHEGTGIGLALVQELVRLHDGTIDVISEPGAGTTFTVTVPLGTAHLPAERIQDEHVATGVAGNAATYVQEALAMVGDGPPEPALRAPLERARILLADDNADMRDYLRRLLERRWTVDAVGDGRSALDAVRKSRPDLVVADVMMPGLDGFELLRALRSDGTTATIPVVLLSARAGEEAVVEGLDAGADDYLVKPFSARELVARVGTQLDLARTRREAEERAEAARVLEAVGDGVFLVSPTGEIRHWNPAAAAITGISTSSAIGRRLTELLPAWEELQRGIVADGPGRIPARAVTLPFDTPDGERWASITGVASAAGTVYAFRDVTDAHELERVHSDIIATVSHELRTPLAAVLGAAKTLGRQDLPGGDETRRRLVALLSSESERLARIIDDILLTSTLEAGTFDFQAVTFDARTIVEDAIGTLESRAGHARTIDFTPPAEPALIVADPDRVHQILVNLLDNSFKYTAPDVAVEVRIEQKDSTCVVCVRDEGRGIPLRDQTRIFGKFHRRDPNMSDGVGGSGLGLHICRELVGRMGGRIWVESRENAGSRFFVELPAAPKSS